jgi:hypothetical protein
MAEFQIAARSSREIRVGRDEKTVATFRPGRWIADMKGEVEGAASAMKLPAPWRGMRYRLQQDGRELASAAKPKLQGGLPTYELEMPGRKLELVAQDRNGLVWVLSEGGGECGRYEQREFGEQDEWTADFAWREDVPALAAFVAWLVLEARAFLAR